MSDDTAQTLIARVIIGTPIRKTTGAQAQGINDLTDVDTTGVQEDHLLQYNASTGRWQSTLRPNGLQMFGGTF